MDRPANQHGYTQTEVAGGIPTSVKPTLIARSPYKYLGDTERDMDRNSSKKPATQAQPPGHHTKSVNPRGPHYSGTHSQHGSSSSSHSSLSDSSSGYSHQTENGSQILRQEDHRLTNPGQYGHQYAARPGDPGYYQHSDVRHAGSTRQQYPAQYPGRTTSNYDNCVPASYYEQQRYYEHRQPYHHPHYRHISRERGPLVKAHSEETFRHERTNGSEKGFSSLGDLPPVHTPVYRQEHPMGQPLMTQYTYQTGPYRELSPTSTQYSHGSAAPTSTQYSHSTAAPTSTQYSHSTATAAYSSDVNRTNTLSERIEGMRIRLDDDNIEILKQPVDQAVNLHESIVFTCDARIVDCQEEPNLLWFKDQEPLIGEIDSTYVITETTEKDAGVYHCLVSHPLNPSQQKESTSATLTINTGAPKTTPPLVSLPEIVKQPLGTLAAVVGEPLEVTIQVSGDEPLSYQWYRNSQPLNFAQSSVLRFPITSITDSGDYCCRVANDHGSILSKVFTLEVTRVRVAADLSDSYLQRVSVTIARQVRDIEELALSLGVRLPDPTAYRSLGEQVLHLLRIWRDTKNGTKKQLVSALKQLRIVLQDSERSQGYGRSKDLDRSQGYGRSKDSDRIQGYGRSKDSDRSQGYGQSKTAKLQFLKQPQSAKVIYGQSVSLHVAVSQVTPSTTYQWYLNGSPLVGQTSSHFTISSVVDSDVGDYLCVVSGSETRIQSEPAVIELTEISHQRRGVPAPAPQTQVFEPPKRYLINRGVPADKDADLLLELRQLPVTKTESPPNIVIDEHPASVEIEPGDPLTLRCRASSSYGDIKYSWYFNGLLIEEEQSDYVLNFSTDEDEGYYTCKVSNQHGSVTSNTAQVKAKLDSD